MLTVLFLVIVMFMPLADPLTKLMPFSVYANEYSSTAQLQNECSSEDGIINCLNNNAETIGDENIVSPQVKQTSIKSGEDGSPGEQGPPGPAGPQGPPGQTGATGALEHKVRRELLVLVDQPDHKVSKVHRELLEPQGPRVSKVSRGRPELQDCLDHRGRRESLVLQDLHPQRILYM